MPLSEAQLRQIVATQERADAAELILLRQVVRDFITSQTEMLRVLNVMQDLAKQEALRGTTIWHHASILCGDAIAAGKRSQLVVDEPNLEGKTS